MASPRGWDAADLEALAVLEPLLARGGYLAWTEGALRPAALAQVCDEVVLGRRRVLVELGAGVSTIVLARLARELGARLTTLEHDPGWARVVREQLERERLTGAAELVEAPLAPHPLALDAAPWYGPEALAALPVSGIDLLLVDGPPGYGAGMELSRYPALPALADRLAPGAVVILDDAGRPGERAIIERWREELPAWRFGRRAEANIAVGLRTEPASQPPPEATHVQSPPL